MQQREYNQRQRLFTAENNRREIESHSKNDKNDSKTPENIRIVPDSTPAANGSRKESSLQQNREIRDPQELAREAAEIEIQQQIEHQLKTVLQWKANFDENTDVQNFSSKELADWRIKTDQTVAVISSSTSSLETLSKLQQITSQAEQIELKAGELSDKFFARNAVLTDILDSLREIGFFVQDPEFADSSNPAGAVIIRANRGNQSLSTSISLDQKVESDWQGVHGEYCTGGFFEFVRAMDQRGVIVNPDNINLKPQLLQKGAKELPETRRKSAGEN
jgi:predicted extracellular nuclease